MIAKLAGQLKGSVKSRETTTIAGRKSRSYEIDYGPGKTLEIAFVLQAKTEYELLCRRRASAPDTTCAAFFSSFAL